MADRIDPTANYRFALEIDGMTKPFRCKEVSGLKQSTKVAKVREGGNNAFEVALIESQTYEPLTLKKAFFSGDDELYQWMYEIHSKSSPITRKTISVVLYQDEDAKEICRWELYGAFPTEYEGPSFDAEAKTIAFESVKINYDFFEFKKG